MSAGESGDRCAACGAPMWRVPRLISSGKRRVYHEIGGLYCRARQREEEMEAADDRYASPRFAAIAANWHGIPYRYERRLQGASPRRVITVPVLPLWTIALLWFYRSSGFDLPFFEVEGGGDAEEPNEQELFVVGIARRDPAFQLLIKALWRLASTDKASLRSALADAIVTRIAEERAAAANDLANTDTPEARG